MAARTNKRDPRAARTLRRISFVREVKQSFLIICEGVNTEPDYFNAFRLTSANIKAVGQGLNTVGLVQKALRMKEEDHPDFISKDALRSLFFNVPGNIIF